MTTPKTRQYRLPLARWWKQYTGADAQGDVIAGLVTAVMLIPQGMAFALMAGLPAQVGLYASMLPMLVYAVLGSSRTLSVGPVSVAAIMVAQTLHTLPAGTDPFAATLGLAFLSGVILLAMGFLRLGLLANLLSHPVLAGFTTAAALLIIVSQLPALTGAAAGAISLSTIESWFTPVLSRPQTLLLGGVAIAFLLIAGKLLQRVLESAGLPVRVAAVLTRTAPLAAIVAGALIATRLNADATTIATVGVIPGGLPTLSLPAGLELLLQLTPAALAISLVGYVESVSIAQSLAHRERERVDPNQELIALGAANLAAGLSSGMPVAGGFSRTMVNKAAGARTPFASIVAATVVTIIAAKFTPLLSGIPKVILAAIIVVGVVQLIDVRGAVAAWRYDRSDGIAFLVTAAGVLILGIETGLALGIVASFAGLIWRGARPHIAELGRVPGTEHFRNIKRHRVETRRGVELLRVDENLTFANAAWIESVLEEQVRTHPNLRHLVLVMSSVSAVDFTALGMLQRVILSLAEADVTLHLAEVKGPVMDHLASARLPVTLGRGKIYLSTHQAVVDLGE